MAMSIRFGIAAAAAWALAGPVWAEATAAGAERLRSALAAYLTDVEVALAGDGYEVTLDLAKAGDSARNVSASPVLVRVSDNADGTWSFSLDQPYTATAAVEGLMQSTTQVESLVAEGVFDEALGDMSRLSLRISGLQTLETRTDPTLGALTAEATLGSLVLEGGARAGADGVDGSWTVTLGDITFESSQPAGEGAPPMKVSGEIGALASSLAVSGYQPKALYPLLAWFVAHPGGALDEADGAALKPLIEAALPLFTALSIEDSYSTIRLDTPIGPVSLGGADSVLEMSGLLPDGRLREAFTLRGLKLPEGVLPPYAATLIPEEAALDITVSRFDLAAAARLALGLLDQPQDPAAMEMFGMRVLMALMPEGALEITLAPGGLRNASYDLGYEAALSAGMGGIPSGTAKLTLTGIEAIMAALAAAPPEVAGQVLPFVGMAQAMGQPGPDGQLIWEIDTTTPGSLKINGMDMMGLQ